MLYQTPENFGKVFLLKVLCARLKLTFFNAFNEIA